MKACLDDITALEIWRRDPQYWKTMQSIYYRPLPQNTANRIKDLRALGIEPGICPGEHIHLLVASPGNRNKIPGYHFRCCKALPHGSLRRINEDVLIISPEMCFLQLARSLNKFELIMVGMELCGKYSLTPEAEKGFTSRDDSLTTPAKIERFLDAASGFHGVKKARATLKYLREGSESPMETCQYMLLCLPKRLGGYGMAEFTVNGELKLNEQAKRLTERNSFRCDLLRDDKRTNKRVAVEYDSKQEHVGLVAFYRDNTKRNILLDMGIKVFVVSAAQILDPDQLDAIAYMISRATGKRLRSFPANWESRRASMRRVLFRSLNRVRHIHKA